MPLSLTLEVCLGTKRTTASSSCSLHLCLLWSISICLFLSFCTPPFRSWLYPTIFLGLHSLSFFLSILLFTALLLFPFSSFPPPHRVPLFPPLLHPFVMSPSAGVVAVSPQYVQHAVPTPRPTRLWDPPHIPSTFTFSFSSTGFLEVTSD